MHFPGMVCLVGTEFLILNGLDVSQA